MFYCPDVGRFLAQDLIRRPADNLYLYGENDPINTVDPLGLEIWICGDSDYIARMQKMLDRLWDLSNKYGFDKWLSFLANTRDQVSIELGPKNQTYPDTRVTDFNPDIKDNPDIHQTRDPLIGLLHELGHQLDFSLGLSDEKGSLTGIHFRTAPGTLENQKATETMAIYFENFLRGNSFSPNDETRTMFHDEKTDPSGNTKFPQPDWSKHTPGASGAPVPPTCPASNPNSTQPTATKKPCVRWNPPSPPISDAKLQYYKRLYELYKKQVRNAGGQASDWPTFPK